ncbi:uncharacterized protein LOC108740636 [Agrilus planipennis]|uniref:Uncharacterized protein LOC108740636 n=1 Tax=Agrilus planipennis TaxID=224129 RepID=A0A1W4XDK5_AGRPL|nr:uncharacterized protein LOC108740636 [Agrilus planipennis]XP_018330513.1 uncharacterized protein LOC108740636 [Agrilus planipennis]XP_018330514.1 uncharacterized protein LOC108740636 [Agrilus planipennis]XP_018330515.1 uncharacterized protein LOC108740636 [Agrilus planipennis]
MADDEYTTKMKELEKYIPFIEKMIIELKDPKRKNREAQLNKMESLHSMITDKRKKLKIDTLKKCEEVLVKLYEKVHPGKKVDALPLSPATSDRLKFVCKNPANENVSPSDILNTIKLKAARAKLNELSTPASPSPPREIIPSPVHKPIVIPTEKVQSTQRNEDSSISTWKKSRTVQLEKPDVYSKVASSLGSNKKSSVFDRLGMPFLSKPPLTEKDLEDLQTPDDTTNDTEDLSLSELEDLRETLKRKLSAKHEKKYKKESIPKADCTPNLKLATAPKPVPASTPKNPQITSPKPAPQKTIQSPSSTSVQVKGKSDDISKAPATISSTATKASSQEPRKSSPIESLDSQIEKVKGPKLIDLDIGFGSIDKEILKEEEKKKDRRDSVTKSHEKKKDADKEKQKEDKNTKKVKDQHEEKAKPKSADCKTTKNKNVSKEKSDKKDGSNKDRRKSLETKSVSEKGKKEKDDSSTIKKDKVETDKSKKDKGELDKDKKDKAETDKDKKGKCDIDKDKKDNAETDKDKQDKSETVKDKKDKRETDKDDNDKSRNSNEKVGGEVKSVQSEGKDTKKSSSSNIDTSSANAKVSIVKSKKPNDKVEKNRKNENESKTTLSLKTDNFTGPSIELKIPLSGPKDQDKITVSDVMDLDEDSLPSTTETSPVTSQEVLKSSTESESPSSPVNKVIEPAKEIKLIYQRLADKYNPKPKKKEDVSNIEICSIPRQDRRTVPINKSPVNSFHSNLKDLSADKSKPFQHFEEQQQPNWFEPPQNNPAWAHKPLDPPPLIPPSLFGDTNPFFMPQNEQIPNLQSNFMPAYEKNDLHRPELVPIRQDIISPPNIPINYPNLHSNQLNYANQQPFHPPNQNMPNTVINTFVIHQNHTNSVNHNQFSDSYSMSQRNKSFHPFEPISNSPEMVPPSPCQEDHYDLSRMGHVDFYPGSQNSQQNISNSSRGGLLPTPQFGEKTQYNNDNTPNSRFNRNEWQNTSNQRVDPRLRRDDRDPPSNIRNSSNFREQRSERNEREPPKRFRDNAPTSKERFRNQQKRSERRSSARYEHRNRYDEMYTRLDKNKEAESFASPLDSLYTSGEKQATGRGYGVQNYKIPKRKHLDESPSQKDRSDNRHKDNKDDQDVIRKKTDDKKQEDINKESETEPKVSKDKDSIETEPTEKDKFSDVCIEAEAENVKEVNKQDTDDKPQQKTNSEPKLPEKSAEIIPEKAPNEKTEQSMLTDFITNLIGGSKKKDLLVALFNTIADGLEEQQKKKFKRIIVDSDSSDDESEKDKKDIKPVKATIVDDESEDAEKNKANNSERVIEVKSDVKLDDAVDKIESEEQINIQVETKENDDAEAASVPMKNEKRRIGQRKSARQQASSVSKTSTPLETKNELESDVDIEVKVQSENEKANIKCNEEESEENDVVFESVGERIKNLRRQTVQEKKKKKKTRTELDMLHEDIKDMFIRDGVLTATGKRMCRILKDDPEALTKKTEKESVDVTPKIVKKDADEITPIPTASRRSTRNQLRVVLEKTDFSKLVPPKPPERVSSSDELESDSNNISGRNLRRSRRSLNKPVVYCELNAEEDASESTTPPSTPQKKVARNSVSSKTDNELEEEIDIQVEANTSSDTIKEIEESQDPEKETKCKKKKKRNYNKWASGVITKNKGKKKKSANESPRSNTTTPTPSEKTEPSVRSDSDHEEINSAVGDREWFVEPSVADYFDKDKKPECKLCPFKGKFIVHHYKQKHKDSEILISRLPPDVTAAAIQESVENNYESVTPEDIIEPNGRKKKFLFKCIFCHFMIKNVSAEIFFDHLTLHTGEYRFICKLCTFYTNQAKPLRAHYSSVHFMAAGEYGGAKAEYSAPPNYYLVFGYVCGQCNYLQLNKEAVEEHIKIFHLDNDTKVFKINMSLEQTKLEAVVKSEDEEVVVPNSPSKNKKKFKAEVLQIVKPEEKEESKKSETDENKTDSDTEKVTVKSEEEVEKVSKVVEPRKFNKPGPKSKKRKAPEDLEENASYKIKKEKKEDELKTVESHEEEKSDALLDKKADDSNETTSPKTMSKNRGRGVPMRKKLASQKIIEGIQELHVAEVDKDKIAGEIQDGESNRDDTKETKEMTDELKMTNDTNIKTKAIDELPDNSTDKQVDRNIFMCDAEIVEREQKIDEERLKKMEEINQTVSQKRVNLKFTEKLKTMLEKPTDVDVDPQNIEEIVDKVPDSNDANSVQTTEINAKINVEDNVSTTQKSQVTRSSRTHIKEKSEKLNFTNLTSKNNTPISNIIQRLQGKLDTEPTVNDKPKPPPLLRLSDLSPLNEDDEGETILVGPVEGKNDKECMIYGCLVDNCVFKTTLEDVFETHCIERHPGTTWDGFCKACNEKVALQEEPLNMNDALRHLAKVHSKHEKDDSFEEKETPRISLRVRRLSGDTLSKSAEASCMEISDEKPVSETSEFPFKILSVTSDTSEEQHNFPFQISCVTTLTPEQEQELEKSVTIENQTEQITSTINTTVTTNAQSQSSVAILGSLAGTKLNVLIPIVQTSIANSILPKSNINRTPIISQNLDTKKRVTLREIPIPPEALKNRKWEYAERCMMPLHKLKHLYKCPEFNCSFTTSNPKKFMDHLVKHPEIIKIQETGIPCLYCNFKTTLEQYTLHIDVRHGKCQYGCTFCFYRAICQSYVQLHMEEMHPGRTGFVYKVAAITRNAKPAMSFPTLKQLIPVIECAHCKYVTLFMDEYFNHCKDKHVLAQLKCFKCKKTYRSFQPLVHHLRIHNIWTYNCRYCPSGTSSTHELYKHLAVKHPTCPPEIIIRQFIPDYTGRTPDEYNYSGEEVYTRLSRIVTENPKWANTKLLRDLSEDDDESPPTTTSMLYVSPNVSAILPGFTTKTVSKTTNAVKSVMSSRPSTSTKPLPPAEDNSMAQLIKLDGNLEKKNDQGGVTLNSQQIFVPDFDNSKETPGETEKSTSLREEERDPLEISASDFENSQSELVATPNYFSEVDFDETMTDEKSQGLQGWQLFKCENCNLGFENSTQFRSHAIKCFENKGETQKPFRCAHCPKNFKTAPALVDHVRVHGTAKFTCSLCDYVCRSKTYVHNHMKTRHKMSNYIVNPVDATKRDMDKDDFIVRPRPVKVAESTANVTNESGNLSTDSKAALFLENKIIKTTFSPQEINLLPRQAVCSVELKCSECPYATKVKTNLVRHLQMHEREKEVPVNAPVNPVPCLDKNEKMFDKMINLAFASNTNAKTFSKSSEKSGLTKEEEEQLPAFVQLTKRYVCGANGCNYLCLEDAMLRHHLLALHAHETEYKCTHCNEKLTSEKGSINVDLVMKHYKLHDLHLYMCSECKFVHHLRHKVDRHLSEKHPLQEARVIVVRDMDSEPHEEDYPKSQMPSSYLEEIKETKPWRCGMCKYRCTTRNEIVAHAYNKHEMTSQYKCALCSYKTASKDSFDEHYSSRHPGQAIDIIDAFYKIDETVSVITKENSFDTTPLWQRDRPRVRHIRGILFDESGRVPKKSPFKITPVSSSLANSNLDEAIEAVATGTSIVLKNIEKASQKASKPTGGCEIIEIKDDSDEEASLNQSGTKTYHRVSEMPILSPIDPLDITSNNDDPLNIEITDYDRLNEVVPEFEDDSTGLSQENREGHRLYEIAEMDINKLIASDLMGTYGPYGKPLNKQYLCPLCAKFKTKNPKDITHHLYRELDYARYCCTICGRKAITFDFLQRHASTVHKTDSPATLIQGLSPNIQIENWVHAVLLVQRRIAAHGTTPKSQTQPEQSTSPSPSNSCTPNTVASSMALITPITVNARVSSTPSISATITSVVTTSAMQATVTQSTPTSSMVLLKDVTSEAISAVTTTPSVVPVAIIDSPVSSPSVPTTVETFATVTLSPSASTAAKSVTPTLTSLTRRAFDTANANIAMMAPSTSPTTTSPASPIKWHYCVHCSYKCKNAKDLKRHVKRHWAQKPFRCGICNFEGISKYEIIIHSKRKHKGLEPSLILIPTPTTPTIIPVINRKRKILSDSDESISKKVDLDTLDNVTPDIVDVKDNLVDASSATTFEDDRVDQLNSPDSEKNNSVYQCNYCPKTETRIVTLEEHWQKAHKSKLRPFRYKTNPSRTRINLRCGYCDWGANIQSLRLHHKDSHPELPFVIYRRKCDKCKAFFLKLSEYSEHPKNCPGLIVTPQAQNDSDNDALPTDDLLKVTAKEYVCIICYKYFGSQNALLKHSAAVHQTEKRKNEDKNAGNASKVIVLSGSGSESSDVDMSRASKLTARKSTSSKITARKSTAARPSMVLQDEEEEGYSYYGTKPKKLDLDKITTEVPFMGSTVETKIEKLAQIVNLFPKVLLTDCKLQDQV